jgi:hypothetical protein
MSELQIIDSDSDTFVYMQQGQQWVELKTSGLPYST